MHIRWSVAICKSSCRFWRACKPVFSSLLFGAEEVARRTELENRARLLFMNETLKRKHFYLTEKWYTRLAILVSPTVAAAGVAPNHVTILNIVNGLVICGLILMRQYWIAAFLIQLYLFLDVLDGNLARYRQMSSRLGAALDNIGDRFFYNAVMIAVGIVVGNHWGWMVFFLVAHNLHAALATYYIVPRIKRLENFKRFRIKQALMDRGYILGMDLSSQDLLLSVLLITPWRALIVPVVGVLYLVDLLFRLWELRLNHHASALCNG